MCCHTKDQRIATGFQQFDKHPKNLNLRLDFLNTTSNFINSKFFSLKRWAFSRQNFSDLCTGLHWSRPERISVQYSSKELKSCTDACKRSDRNSMSSNWQRKVNIIFNAWTLPNLHRRISSHPSIPVFSASCIGPFGVRIHALDHGCQFSQANCGMCAKWCEQLSPGI